MARSALQQAYVANIPTGRTKGCLEATAATDWLRGYSHTRYNPGFRQQMLIRQYGDIFLRYDGPFGLWSRRTQTLPRASGRKASSALPWLGTDVRALKITKPGDIAFADTVPLAAPM